MSPDRDAWLAGQHLLEGILGGRRVRLLCSGHLPCQVHEGVTALAELRAGATAEVT